MPSQPDSVPVNLALPMGCPPLPHLSFTRSIPNSQQHGQADVDAADKPSPDYSGLSTDYHDSMQAAKGEQHEAYGDAVEQTMAEKSTELMMNYSLFKGKLVDKSKELDAACGNTIIAADRAVANANRDQVDVSRDAVADAEQLVVEAEAAEADAEAAREKAAEETFAAVLSSQNEEQADVSRDAVADAEQAVVDAEQAEADAEAARERAVEEVFAAVLNEETPLTGHVKTTPLALIVDTSTVHHTVQESAPSNAVEAGSIEHINGWRSVFDPSSGNHYYYNESNPGDTTCWKLPTIT